MPFMINRPHLFSFISFAWNYYAWFNFDLFKVRITNPLSATQTKPPQDLPLKLLKIIYHQATWQLLVRCRISLFSLVINDRT